MNENADIHGYLQQAGCCRICCLRFLKGRLDDFVDVEEALKKRDIPNGGVTDVKENASKKFRANICVACLGLLDGRLMETLLEQIVTKEALRQYDCQGFTSSVSLPIALHLRQLSLWLAVLERFPDRFNKTAFPDVTVKDAFKMILNQKLELALDKKFSVNGVMVNVNFKYANEEAELQLLEKIKPEVFVDRKAKKHCKKDFITRNAFEKHFTPASVSAELFRKYIAIPPVVQAEGLVLEQVSFTGPTVFLAGRYNKLSRELSQTPWVIDGKRKMANSVQEIMTAVVAPWFGVPPDGLIFSSSGREDVDVRCLGEGRPFVLEIPGAFKDYLTEERAADMEKAIDETLQISVKDLQLVEREELVHIKQGEEDKKKFYRALCVLKKPVTNEVVDALNINEPFVIEQWTPLRVLHRRPLLSRSRTVYSVKAFASTKNDCALVVDVVTQAGTYIKELVHSDFGRTSPSFKSIIGQEIDIHALDVMAVYLDWPKRLRR
ncbi:putative tRNA pseudouridine synthase Pus10 isoform X2 [Sabethes cyaneus]|uniref:putative tRNA pseudouridine synthase Pus10 isoform X2 n=1 Tax=Sabethes cyaneus TaxID=53552 RepID=UPI00237E1DF4|nr:putative tRNA pseudouridine synthase Pus10 isoform X2 [Sabethes cyaneus]